MPAAGAPLVIVLVIVIGLALAVLASAAVVDVRRQRLPDALVGLAAVVVVLGAVVASVTGDAPRSPVPLVHVVAGGALAAGPVLALHLVDPRSMGFGDVKAAAVVGGVVGLVDARLALVALCAAAGLGGAFALARGRATIAFGPFLVGAGIVTLLAATFGPEVVPWP